MNVSFVMKTQNPLLSVGVAQMGSSSPRLVDVEVDIFGTHEFRNPTDASLICIPDDTGTDYPLIKVRYKTQMVDDQRVKYKKIRRAKIGLDGRRK